MKKYFAIFLICSLSFFPRPNYAFDFGATAVAIYQLIRQHVAELAALEELIRQGKDTYRLANDVYRGINDTLRILESLEDKMDPGTFKRLKYNLEAIINKVERIYGKVPNTARAESLLLHDETVVDTIARHNQIYDDHEKLKEQRKWIEYEILKLPSPGRAAQVSLSVQYEILKALTRIEKNQAQGLKLLALSLGQQNEMEKKRSEESMEQYDGLEKALDNINFDTSLSSLR